MDSSWPKQMWRLLQLSTLTMSLMMFMKGTLASGPIRWEVTPALHHHAAAILPLTPMFCIQCNIQALALSQLERLAADIWMMAPPCQPYTRRWADHLQNDAPALLVRL